MEWILIVFAGGLAGLLYYRNSLLVPVEIEKDPSAIYQSWSDVPFNIGQPNNEGHWNRAVLVITPHEVRIQTKQEKAVRFNALKEELRGFCFADGEICIHAYIGTTWYVLKVRVLDSETVMNALREITVQGYPTPLLPILAHHKNKDVIIYLAPYTFVIFSGGLVQECFDLLDTSDWTGNGNSLSFSANGQRWEFTLETPADDWLHEMYLVRKYA